jgi:hypothetical protein
MDGIQELYLAGRFEKVEFRSPICSRVLTKLKFGLSNFSVQEVEDFYNYAKSKYYVLPTIYQSICGLAARQNEKELFPSSTVSALQFKLTLPLRVDFWSRPPPISKLAREISIMRRFLGKFFKKCTESESIWTSWMNMRSWRRRLGIRRLD